ncbi:Protein of unknown function [Gryllus bimaculatus]|nr:Protein of unknown function [Gryllus bimaculatus]
MPVAREGRPVGLRGSDPHVGARSSPSFRSPPPFSPDPRLAFLPHTRPAAAGGGRWRAPVQLRGCPVRRSVPPLPAAAPRPGHACAERWCVRPRPRPEATFGAELASPMQAFWIMLPSFKIPILGF